MEQIIPVPPSSKPSKRQTNSMEEGITSTAATSSFPMAASTRGMLWESWAAPRTLLLPSQSSELLTVLICILHWMMVGKVKKKRETSIFRCSIVERCQDNDLCYHGQVARTVKKKKRLGKRKWEINTVNQMFWTPAFISILAKKNWIRGSTVSWLQ